MPGDALSFAVPGQPVPWQRTALYRGRRITPKRQRVYQAAVRAAAQQAIPARWPLDARYQLAVACVTDRRHRDVDNIVKTVADALNGVAYEDDWQIDDLRVTRSFGRPAGLSVRLEVVA